MLTSKQRAYLRSMANTTVAIGQVGKDGINANLIRSLSDALEAREIVKLSVLESSLMTAKEASEQLCAELSAEPVQCIGNKLVLYRAKSKKPVIVLPE